MRTVEEIQDEIIKLKRNFQKQIEALNEIGNKENENYYQDFIKTIDNNMTHYLNDIMVLEWVLGNQDHY